MPRPTRDEILTGPIAPVLARLAGPMALGIVAVLAFNLVDAYFIGRIGKAELAAVAFAYPVTFLVSSVAMGLSVGTSTAVARASGAGDDRAACRISVHSLSLGLAAVAVIAGLGFLVLDPALRAMGASEELAGLAEGYLNVWLGGIVLLVVPMLGNGALRGVGDTVTPSLVMLVAGGINGLLDPLLIFGYGPVPPLGLRGAAWATLISWAFTLVASLYLLRREKLLSWDSMVGGGLLKSWGEVLVVGLPAVGTNLLVPVSTAVLTAVAAPFGPEVVAAYGVGSRVESLALVGVMAVGSVLSIFVGQNWGAGHCDRVRRATRLGWAFAGVWGVGVWAVLFALRWPIAAAFSENAPQVRAATAAFLTFVPLGYAGTGAGALTGAMFNALKRPLKSTLIIAARLFLFCVPLAWVGAKLGGLNGFLLGIAAGNLAAGAFALWLGRSALRTDGRVAETAGAPREPAEVCV